MKTKLTILTLLSCVGLFLLIFSGCYTQLASMRDEQEGDEEYTTTGQQNNDSIISENEGGEYRDESGCCEDSYRPHVGYSYYYPSSYWPSAAFSLAYADPWFYDYAWRYSSWYNYYSPAWYPYYGYSPYYYNPAYYYGYDYGYGTTVHSGGRRTDGSVLSAGRDRDARAGGYEIQNTGRTDINLPVGASLSNTPGSAPPNRIHQMCKIFRVVGQMVLIRYVGTIGVHSGGSKVMSAHRVRETARHRIAGEEIRVRNLHNEERIHLHQLIKHHHAPIVVTLQVIHHHHHLNRVSRHHHHNHQIAVRNGMMAVTVIVAIRAAEDHKLQLFL